METHSPSPTRNWRPSHPYQHRRQRRSSHHNSHCSSTARSLSRHSRTLRNHCRPFSRAKPPFKWTSTCDEAHDKMKLTFACKISLRLPTAEGTFHLHTDASSFAGAGVLSQDQSDGVVPIAFYSKAFDETQMRYSILDKELYAMVNAIKHFEFYLQGRRFKIFTDSKILYYLREAKESNPKLMRWSLLLQDYDFDITHISGKSNKIADILSRVSPNDEEDTSRKIHTAKKEILNKIRDQVQHMDIPNGLTLSMTELNTMIAATHPRSIKPELSYNIVSKEHMTQCLQQQQKQDHH